MHSRRCFFGQLRSRSLPAKTRDAPIGATLLVTMHTAMQQTLLASSSVMLRPLSVPRLPAPRVGPSQQQVVNHQAYRHRTLAAASDVNSPEETQSVPGSPPENRMEQRIRRKVKSWRKPGTGNSTLISVSFATNAEKAAARALSNLSDTKPTHIVARSPEDVAKAVSILHIVGNKLGKQEQGQPAAEDQAVMQDQDEQQQDKQRQEQQQTQQHTAAVDQKAAAPAKQQILVFQPQQAFGVMINPPDIPEGAQILYTYPLPADTPAYQQAIQAYDQTKADGQDAIPNHHLIVNVKRRSNTREAAKSLMESVQHQGWAEMNCIGGPAATAKGLEVIISARRTLLKQNQGSSEGAPVPDVAAVFLKYWKKPTQQPNGSPQESFTGQNVQPGLESVQQQKEKTAKISDGRKPREYLDVSTFLVFGCAANKPKQLKQLSSGGQ